MTAHLGPAATAFVDGQLDHTQRDEVLAHLLHCRRCLDEVEGMRALKSALRGAPVIPLELSLRLLAAVPDHAAPPQPTRRHPRLHRGGLRRTAARRAVVGGAVMAIGIGSALGLAGPPPAGQPPRVDPSSVRFVIDHAATAGEVPFSEPAIATVSTASTVR